MRILGIAVICLATSTAQAKHLHPEKAYQQQWCGRFNGQTEVILQDKTRVDCITDNYAVEFDFANKWAECLGQALHYAEMTGKLPACVLIIEKKSDWKHLEKLQRTGRANGIKAWYIRPRHLDKRD